MIPVVWARRAEGTVTAADKLVQRMRTMKEVQTHSFVRGGGGEGEDKWLSGRNQK